MWPDCTNIAVLCGGRRCGGKRVAWPTTVFRLHARATLWPCGSRRCGACAALLAAVTLPSVAYAANYALLIGVSNYTFKDITPLKGPANDVTLMWRALGKRGFSDVTVLADGLASGPAFPASAGQPTRANILDAFAALGQRAKAGDLVLIYFSGHGTEQPVRSTDQDPERGNLDQVMLPIDAGGYDRATETVQNGIIDDEIGVALDKMRARGADVWMVVDACHAGSMTRGVFDGLAVRGIESSRLGVPAAPPAPATRGTAEPIVAVRDQAVVAERGLAGRVLRGRQFARGDRAQLRRVRSPDGRQRQRPAHGRVHLLPLPGAERQQRPHRHLPRPRAPRRARMMRASQIAPPAMPTFGGALDRPLLSIGKAPPPAAWEATLVGNTVEIPAGSLPTA